MTINLSAIFGDEPLEVATLAIAEPPADEPFPDPPRGPAEQLPSDFGRTCGAHNDPAGWTYTPDRYNRTGWRTVSCKYCGRFIGYQPPR
jgi:hypothetical protein